MVSYTSFIVVHVHGEKSYIDIRGIENPQKVEITVLQ